MHFTYSRHRPGLVQRVSGREGLGAEHLFCCQKRWMKTALTESAAYWNKIILGNKSQSEHCNNSAAVQTQIDVLFSLSAASKAPAKKTKKQTQNKTLIQFVLLPFWWRNIQERVWDFFLVLFCRAAVGFACSRFTRFQHEVVCLSCSITIKKEGKKKKEKAVEIMLMSLHTYTHMHTK